MRDRTIHAIGRKGGENRRDGRLSAVLLTQSFPPETHAGANRAVSFATALAEDFDLTVVAPRPSHPHPERFLDVDVAAHDRDQLFSIVRTRAFAPHSAGYIRRGLREIGLALDLILRRPPSPDLLIATSPSFFLGPLGLARARFWRVPFAWDLRDLTWAYTTEGQALGAEHRRLRLAAARAMTVLAQSTIRRSTIVTASNDGIAAYAALYRRHNDVLTVPNGVDREIYESLHEAASTTPKNKRTIVMYAGALGYFQVLDALVDAAALLPKVEFRVVGDGTERDRLEQRADGLANLTFTGYVSRDKLVELYQEADILFAQLRDLPVMAEATFPSKVFEYLAAGRPIVYAGRGITADFLRSTGSAIIAEPEDPESVRCSIEKLVEDNALRRDLGQRAREAARYNIRQDIARTAARQLAEAVGFGR